MKSRSTQWSCWDGEQRTVFSISAGEGGEGVLCTCMEALTTNSLNSGNITDCFVGPGKLLCI